MTTLVERLKRWHPTPYAKIAAKLQVSRQHVRRVAEDYDLGRAQSRRVVKALLKAVEGVR